MPPGTARIEARDALGRLSDADYIDLSPAAQQNFWNWVAYEVQLPNLSRGAKDDLTAGIAACSWRNKGLTAERVLGLLESEMGYLGGGAAAVLRGALAALCSSLDLGYRTRFDKDVDIYTQSLVGEVDFHRQPVFYEYGFFMKATCQGMAAPDVGGTRIFDRIKAQSDSGELTLAGGPTSDTVLYLLIQLAVRTGCIGYFDRLPPVIQMA